MLPVVDQGLTADGVDLADLALIGESLAGLMTTPENTTKALVVPGRHGQLPPAWSTFGPTEFVIPFLLRGALPDGAVPAGTTDLGQLYARADELCRVFRSGRTVELAHTVDGQTRTATPRVLSALNVLRDRTEKPMMAKVSVAFTVDDAFWSATTPTATGAVALTSRAPYALIEFAGASAPMADLSITFIGPINNPDLRQPATGGFVAYDGVIAAGQTLTIHCDDRVAVPLVGTGGLIPDYTKLRYLPPRWFELDPAEGLVVELHHTGGGSAAFSITGREKYLLG